MKITLKKSDGSFQNVEVVSLAITLDNGETIEVSGENGRKPAHLAEGVVVWGGKIPDEHASVEKLKSTTRMLGIYPLAANTIHVYPVSDKS